MTHVVGSTRNDVVVKVDLATSDAAKHISRHPHLLTLASEVLSGMMVKGLHPVITHDMGRIIGYDFVIEPADKTAVFYAQLVKDTVFVPFTKKGEPTPTRCLTMVLRFDKKEQCYFLDNVWLGAFRPSLPGDTAETDSSKEYWEGHAFVFEDQHIKANSITHDCPY